MFAGICLHFPGINANSALCLKTEATETALESGMAKGEFAGYFGNLRALTVAVGPFIFGAVGKPLGKAARCLCLIRVARCAQETCMRSGGASRRIATSDTGRRRCWVACSQRSSTGC